ncbi:MAG: SNF2-related protein, partial [Candidatus Dormibacteria bacterium]
ADPRMGKTLVSTDLLESWGTKRNLVVAPLVVCPQWVNAALAAGFTPVSLYPCGAKRIRGVLEASMGHSGRFVAVINYDKIHHAYEDLVRWDAQALILDESHYMKSPSAKRSRYARKLAERIDKVRLLSGIPAPNHYGDLWAQMAALSPKEWGSNRSFRLRYLITDPLWPSRVLGHRNEEELLERVSHYADFYRREDCFGADSWQTVTRHVTLPPSARVIYENLKQGLAADLADGVQLTTTHLLQKITKLQQAAAGFVLHDGETHHIHQAKLEAVEADLDEIAESGQKAVIFCKFIAETDAYAKLAAKYGTTYVIRGDKTPEQREEAIRAVEQDPGPIFVICQIQAGGIGISLRKCTHALFVSRDFSFSNDLQARDRIYARGEPKVVTYYQATKTIDNLINVVLSRKENLHTMLQQKLVNLLKDST